MFLFTIVPTRARARVRYAGFVTDDAKCSSTSNYIMRFTSSNDGAGDDVGDGSGSGGGGGGDNAGSGESEYWLVPPPDIDPTRTRRPMPSKSPALHDAFRARELVPA